MYSTLQTIFLFCMYTSIPCLFSSWVHSGLILYPLKSPSRIEHSLWVMERKYEKECKNGSKLLKWHHLFIAWISTCHLPYLCSCISFHFYSCVVSIYLYIKIQYLTYYMKYYQDKPTQLIKYILCQVKNVASIHFNCLNLVTKFLEVFINLYIFNFILLLFNIFILSFYFIIYE